mgnify:FL=1
MVQTADEWVVIRNGQELARFPAQNQALNEVAYRLRDADASQPAALSMRYERRRQA